MHFWSYVARSNWTWVSQESATHLHTPSTNIATPDSNQEVSFYNLLFWVVIYLCIFSFLLCPSLLTGSPWPGDDICQLNFWLQRWFKQSSVIWCLVLVFNSYYLNYCQVCLNMWTCVVYGWTCVQLVLCELVPGELLAPEMDMYVLWKNMGIIVKFVWICGFCANLWCVMI
jgi:hypothetical protein